MSAAPAAVLALAIAACSDPALIRAQDAMPKDPDVVSSREPVSIQAASLTRLGSELLRYGLQWHADYIGQVMGDVSGGLKQGAVYEGLAKISLDLGLEQLTGWWHGGRARVSAIYPHGENPSRELVGDLQGLSNIAAYNSVALYDLWFEQDFAADRVSLRAGQLLADEEFAGTDYGDMLINSSFGWPAFISGNTRNTGPAFPRGGLGIRLRIEPVKAWYLQAGVYDGDTLDSPAGRTSNNPNGVHWELNSRQGAFAIGETGWRVNQGTSATGLRGTYKLGAWLNTGEFADRLDPARKLSPDYGAYFVAHQLVWRETTAEGRLPKKVGLFVRCGASPPDRNLFQFTLDSGAYFRGWIPGRSADEFALGIAYVQISRDVRRAEEAAGRPVISDYESALEASYRMLLWSHWTLQPDFQWISHPGGSPAHPDAFVVGLRASVAF